MEKYFLLLIITVLFTACKNEKTIIHIEKPKEVEVVEKDTSWHNEFIVFFDKFAIDSVYQKEHVQYPLKEMYHQLNSNGNDSVITLYTNKIEYEYLDFTNDKTAKLRESDAYTVEIEKNTDTIYYSLRGINNGIYSDFKFIYNENSWRLFEIEDQSN